jgi:hypothetical protein
VARSRMVDNFGLGEKLGPYDEYPVFIPGIDPQMYLSRNDRPQPFYLICEKDTLLVQMSGSARLQMKHPDVLGFSLSPGDYVYVPAGTPHRLIPESASINQRYKAEQAGLEGVAWYCESCQQELHRVVWDTKEQLCQEGYLAAVEQFNAGADRRTCKACGAVHPTVDTTGFRWPTIAKELREAGSQPPAPNSR